MDVSHILRKIIMKGYFGGRGAVVKPTVELTGECSLEGCHRCDPDAELATRCREG